MTEQNKAVGPSETGASLDLPEIEPTMNELFTRNPLDWDESDLELAIKHMRAGREIFYKEDTEAKKTNRRVNVKKAIKAANTLTLEDIGL